MSKRLELVWPNKDKVLLGLDDNGKPIWGTKYDLEPRLLVQLEAVGQTNPDNLDDLYEQGDNLLIKGDNLLALKALERHFAGKIKCIYIDPPFNTGNAFEHYDDGLEHTIWLSIMKARLEILRKLLRDDGAIFISIDSNELAYLKILLDEIFGRLNFVDLISVEALDPSGFRTSGSFLASAAQYVLWYALDRTKHKINQQYVYCNYDKGYNKVIVNKEDDYTRWQIENISEVVAREIGFENSRKAKRAIGREAFEDMIAEYALQNAEKVFQPVAIGGGARQLRLEIIEQSRRERGRVFRHYREGYGEIFILNGRQIYFYSNKLRPIDGELAPTIPLSNIWTDISWNAISREGGVNFPQSKKPEALLRRIIEMTTQQEDWVLDSFLGSGTTAAVAHKLGRKWVGIELGEHAETLCLPRLKRVVSGEDQTGISRQVGWQGGGGFRYCVLGESLFAKDEDTGLVMINPQYTNGPLVAALCNLEDFKLNNDSVFHGARGNIYAHITEEKVTQAYLDSLVERLPPGKSLTIYCLKRALNLRMPQEVKIKRIPKELQIPRYLTNSGKGGTE